MNLSNTCASPSCSFVLIVGYVLFPIHVLCLALYKLFSSFRPPSCSLVLIVGFVLEQVDLEYPQNKHKEHNDYPLAPERMTVDSSKMSPYQQQLLQDLGLSSSSCEKLVPNLFDKERYVIHYQNLQLYVQLGLRVQKLHKVLSFRQSPWMCPYITKNTELRTAAANSFDKDFYKLMNNAVSCIWGSLCVHFLSRDSVTIFCEVFLLDYLIFRLFDYLSGFSN